MFKLYLFDEYEQVTEEFIVCALRFLPENRRIRAQRYRRTIDRWNCVITYLMLQYGLRECFGITSFELAFGEYGKPYLSDYPDVHFNISHCDAGCAVVVADRPVGVDIQDVRPFSWDVARQVCCERELAKLEQCANRDRLFTTMWVIKESYGKLTEEGIKYRMKDFDTVTVLEGKSPARTILRANILLASDRWSERYMTVSEISKAYHTTPTTVQTVRTSYCEKGLEAPINRKKGETSPVPTKVTGEVEAHVMALACGEPPEGYSRWTLWLLADKTVELGYIESISHRMLLYQPY